MSISTWIEKKLGDILRLNYGWSLPEKKRVAGEFPVYGSNGIVGSHKQAFVNSPGLIVGRKGSAGNVHYSPKPFCPIDTTFFIAPGDTTLDLAFLYYLLLHLDLKRILGDVGVPGLNREVAYREKARFPEKQEEQRRIAAVLGLVQQAMEQQERLIALTSELKRALVRKLFTEGLRGEPQKETEIGPLPESWEVKRLEEVALIIMGQSPDGESYNTDGKGVPLINGPVEFGPNPLSKTLDAKFTTKPTKFCEQGDLILCVRGSTTGRTNIANGRACIGRGVAAIRAKGNQGYLNQFIVSIRDRIYAMGAGTTFPNVSGSQIKDILVPIPALEEQAEIDSLLANIDSKHGILERKRTTLSSLFRTLLHQLMTAQIRVHDLDLYDLEAGGDWP